jgi:hypothetical protein
MNTSDKRGAYEQALGIAHKWLWIAQQRATDVGLDEAEEELRLLTQAVTGLNESSLRGRGRRIASGMLPPSELSCVSEFRQTARRASGGHER